VNLVESAGFVMGIMIIPFVSSLSDDIITQVPRALRDGSLGLVFIIHNHIDDIGRSHQQTE
jgi:ABC-type phosphate transport system permease subunit